MNADRSTARMDVAYTNDVLDRRRAKDAFFARSQRSPLPGHRRPDFVGLAYFAPDPSHRLAGLRLEPAGDDGLVPIAVETSDDRTRTAYRIGRLRFSLEGRDLVLTAYRIGDSASESLFIPFRDATSGHETYGAGRYLDVEPEADGTFALDFNEAYQPYCAYSDAYSCPLPPAENWLPIRIEAGERLGTIYRSERGD
jgi:uncharacterized protein